jgi:sporulation protein YlmC with PRC-barrel domain
MKKLPIAAAITSLGLALATGGIAAQTATGTGTGTGAQSPAAGTAATDQPSTAGSPTGAATGSAAPGAAQGASTPVTGTAGTGTGTGTAAPARPMAGGTGATAGDTAKPDRQARADWERRHRASKMIGTNVRDQQGDRVGSIEDIVLDPQGNVAYAVISAGGFLGMGENLYAVPWSSLQMPQGEDHYVMNVNKEQMRQAHGFDKDNWPDMSGAQWRGFYGGSPAGGATAPTGGQAIQGTGTTGTTTTTTTGPTTSPMTTDGQTTGGTTGGTAGGTTSGTTGGTAGSTTGGTTQSR